MLEIGVSQWKINQNVILIVILLTRFSCYWEVFHDCKMCHLSFTVTQLKPIKHCDGKRAMFYRGEPSPWHYRKRFPVWPGDGHILDLDVPWSQELQKGLICYKTLVYKYFDSMLLRVCSFVDHKLQQACVSLFSLHFIFSWQSWCVQRP